MDPVTPLPGEVEAAFESVPPDVRARLLELREVILATARETEGVGELEESLRWGEPAFLTSETGAGSTVRIAPLRGSSREYGLFFNCQTTLVERFRQWFPRGLRFEGNRAIVFDIADPLPRDAVVECVSAALTYHLDKRRRRSS